MVTSSLIKEAKIYNREKTALRMGENICKPSNWQSPNIQTAHSAQYQKKRKNQKMGRRSK